eukprot:CAMPEP_0184478564 /NCGR_PEP_ID=MMETSP0113_2-20130426/544_1 /TAXON_ID=91329 /ORGANISM="Norrisiella sphaerica, Strain BC52" /LENGTH=760 /DNA_ID=CAMNT_0026856409 /DNA_START=238 /DNA_END=2520 /DNA_ORIENTATION=-
MTDRDPTRLEKINARFEKVDWTDLNSICTTLPAYKQELIKLSSEGAKNVSKKVEIEMFNLWTPYKDKQLYKQTELILEPRKRHALFGHNGCGKSTLFRAMASGALFDQGFPKHISVLHMQEIETSPDNGTLMETVINSHELLYCLRKCKAKLSELIEKEPKEEYKANMEWVDSELTLLRSDEAEAKVSKMLKPLGFDEKAQQKNVNELSGGLRMRVALVCAFFQQPDLLLLDEPTNHLDFPSVLWLENRLRGYPGSFLLVTHDRQLLENVCNSVMLIEEKEINYYKMDFKAFEKRKALDDKKKYEERERFISRNRNPDPSTPTGRRVAMYKRWIKDYTARQVAIGDMFTFPDPSPLPGVDPETPADEVSLIDMKDVTFGYPGTDVKIFKKPTNCTITAGTRMGIMGPNGAGKSTFLKLLTGRLQPSTGSVTVAEGFKLAYFGQHSAEELDLEMTPFEWMCFKYPEEKQQGKLKHHLKKAGMEGGMSETRMKGFSGGQKARVIFAQLTYVCPHLLIMDEPTNFLDLESVDSLIAACNKYSGAMLLVTHSRHMLHSCGNIYLSITPGKFQFFESIKDCERASYSFIKDVEEGGKVKINKVQGGSGEQVEEEEEEEFTMEAIMKRRQKHKEMLEAKAKAAIEEKQAKLDEKKAKVVVKAQKDDWAVGDECLAFWHEDRKFYKAKVRQVSKKGAVKVCCTFLQYGNSVVLDPAQLLVIGATPTKEIRQSAYYLHLEAVKAKKAAQVAKKEKLKQERMKKRRQRR